MSNAFMVRIEIFPGTDREYAAKQAIAFAKKIDEWVVYNFNGAEIHAWPTSSEYALEQQYKEYFGDFKNDWRCTALHLDSD